MMLAALYLSINVSSCTYEDTTVIIEYLQMLRNMIVA